MIRLRNFGLLLLLIAALSSGAPSTDPVRERRLQWWREARFGMFIHWGLYAIPAGVWDGKDVPGIGEWIMNRAKIPVAEYEKLAAKFNPVRFDADQWAAVAKNAVVPLPPPGPRLGDFSASLEYGTGEFA